MKSKKELQEHAVVKELLVFAGFEQINFFGRLT